jgi:hypothetical protein
MSRDITTGFRTEVTAGSLRPVVLMEAYFDSGTIRFWNGIGTLTYGGNSYTGSGNLLKFTEIMETQKLEARGISFELSGIPSSMISVALNEDWQDRNVKLMFAVMDSSNVIIADPFQFFSGKADVIEITEGRDTCVIKLSAENDLITLNRKNERRRTPEDQKISYATDKFFDQVATLQSKEFVWGKK